MKNSSIFSWVFLTFALLSSGLSHSESSSNQAPLTQWINGSWVNIRLAPAPDAPVLTRLIVNTPVTLIAKVANSKFCEITWQASETHGFISCNLLGSEPLKIKEIGVEFFDDEKLNPHYSPTRAFWLEPSFIRLQAAGQHFWKTMLTPEQKALETVQENGNRDFKWENRPTLRRFPIPEFEAMKDLLKNGIIASTPQDRQPPAMWKDLKKVIHAKKLDLNKASSAIRQLNPFFPDSLSTIFMLQQIELPAISTSYFKNINDIGRPSAGTEEISAQFKIPYAIKIINGASWQNAHYNGIYLFGSWDMGEADFFLKESIYVHTLSKKSLIKSEVSHVPNGFRIDNEEGENCHEGFQLNTPITTSIVQNLSSSQNNESLFFFYTKTPLPITKSKVIKGSWHPLKTDEAAKWGQPHEVFTHGLETLFDINDDGIPDFALWEGKRSTFEANKPELNLRMIFTNAGGQWYLLDIDDLIYMCTC
ncbi:MAG: hypothetical protein Q7S87_11910 [Agitococcus sp.]|nr:hypothetical protein [Agitococcus sp.]